MGKVIEAPGIYCEEPRDGTEGTYRHQGLSWLNAAKILYENDQAHMMGPFYYIVSHAFELFTKAFLLWRGVPHQDLRNTRKYGHDIDSLVSKARMEGLELEEEYLPLIEALKNLNQDHMQRYMRLGTFELGRQDYIEPDSILVWVEKYYEKVYGIIREEKSNTEAKKA